MTIYMISKFKKKKKLTTFENISLEIPKNSIPRLKRAHIVHVKVVGVGLT